MINKKTISVLGAGAMGWGIAYLLSCYERALVRIWDRDLELIAEAKKNRTNSKNSDPEIKMPVGVDFFSDLNEAMKGAQIVLLAVPSFVVREICQEISSTSPQEVLMISKGMEEKTSLLPFQVAEEVLGAKTIFHITGAGYGKEVHKKILAAEVLASKNADRLAEIKNLFETEWLTIQTSTDLLGVQLAGALKNVMVIGIGLTLGSTANPELRAGLIEEGVREMIALGNAMGAAEKTFWGPAGKGDLEISADPLSRNYRLGRSLAEKDIIEIQKELRDKHITVEGFHTAFACHRLAGKYGLSLPLVDNVYQVIYERKNPEASIREISALVQSNI